METGMLASFADELYKIAAGNVIQPTVPAVGGMGANVVGKPLPTPGIGKGDSLPKPKPAKPTNYTMVHSNAPMAAFDAGVSSKSVPPPPVGT
jgi:hypothetical protein